ncbi:host-nuclease inhibitor Gam family protein [Patescibacteria group bacterium]|nr:host-nuclease inhibitor Gam family protein [Patescibacteria group bacterium]MBU4057496.1 host-nuclease inhibitor Gam family protein [Patescibacteria group bacterium]MBU4115863.1 host-nuclease inhibitor Gam family protein [Patescibacteria group bacterium]
MAKQALKRDAVTVPQSSSELTDYVRRIGEAQRKIQAIFTDLNSEVECLKGGADEKKKPLVSQIDALLEGVYIYAEAHRDELTEGGKIKTVKFSSGDIVWRITPPKVTLKNIEKVVAELLSRGLKRFLRYPDPEVDKEAMLREQEVAKKVPGVKIGQHEEFVVKPAGLEAKGEVVKELRKLVA